MIEILVMGISGADFEWPHESQLIGKSESSCDV